MDPVSAISFASAILGVIDFSIKVVSEAHEIYKDGSTQEHTGITQIAQDFTNANAELRSSIARKLVATNIQDQNDKALDDLAEASIAIADELLRLLNRLKVDGNARLWTSARKALMTVWKKDKIDAMRARLDVNRSELVLRVVIANKNNLDGLDGTLRQSVQLMLDRQDNASLLLGNLLRRSEHADQVAGQRHLELLATIRASTFQNAIAVPNTTPTWQDTNVPIFTKGIQNTVLQSLSFSRMEDREEEITVAHKKTFEWVFCNLNNQKKNKKWDDLPDWLRRNSGLYWVNGKAASGKSTLMKFIRHDPRTYEALKSWANPHQLLVSSFYFWNSGTTMQKSLYGLLRSILHDILQSRPDLCPVVVTGSWRGSILQKTPPSEPTLTQLQRGFQNLLSQENADFRICLIIDGLDEYDCAEIKLPDLAEVFKSVSMSTNAKIILSSRPLLVFEEAFAKEPQLRLQDLTADDIAIYVDDKLRQHVRWPDLRLQQETGNLIPMIVGKASGVFLWVILVVKSLLEGFTNGDSIQELQGTLNELPEALEDLFRHMFRKIPLRYHQEASQIFQIVRHFQVHAPRSSDQIFREQVLSATALSFAVEGPAKHDHGTKLSPLNTTQSRERRLVLERRLKSRCCGLIEIHDKNNSAGQSLPVATREELTLSGAEIQFIHKTVTDFLDDQAIWKTIIDGSIENFDASLALLRSCVMQLAHLDIEKLIQTHGRPFDPYQSPIGPIVSAATVFAKLAKDTPVQIELLNEMDRIVGLLWAVDSLSEQQHWSDLCSQTENYNRPCEWHDTFLAFCIRKGVLSYVAAEFSKHGKALIQKKKGRPLLDYAVRIEPLYRWYVDAISPDITNILLKNGANPNKSFNGWTAWSNALYTFHEFPTMPMLSILRLLLRNGADPDACIDKTIKVGKRVWIKGRYSALRVLQQAYDRVGPFIDLEMQSEIASIIKLLQQKGAKEREWQDGKLVYPQTQRVVAAVLNRLSVGSNKEVPHLRVQDLSPDAKKNILHRMVLRVKRKDHNLS